MTRDQKDGLQATAIILLEFAVSLAGIIFAIRSTQ